MTLPLLDHQLAGAANADTEVETLTARLRVAVGALEIIGGEVERARAAERWNLAKVVLVGLDSLIGKTLSSLKGEGG